MQKYTLFHRYHNRKDLYDVISSFETGNQMSLNIFGSDIDHLWAEFREYFTYAEAAGGLVLHPTGHYLFIIRNGRWDLPKGHMEEGEMPEECAIREVQEECGISGHTITRELHSSYHTWQYEGISYLKRTYWFHMSYNGEMIENPQAEEGITDARWLKPEKVSIIRQSAWHSLTDLINTVLKI